MRSMTLFLVALLVNGCSILDRREFIEPQVQLTDVTFADATLLESVVIFQVRVENDNPYPIDLDGSRHQFYLNDTYIGKGTSSYEDTIPKLGEVTFPVTVRLSNLSMLGNIQAIINRSEFSYKLKNTLFVDRGYGNSSIESASVGKLASNDLI